MRTQSSQSSQSVSGARTGNMEVIRCRAAVCWGLNEPLVIEEVDVDPPQGTEVRIRMVSASFCHSDMLAMEGVKLPDVMESDFPMVLGHEGAGVVESVGPGVTSLAPGDSVIPLLCAQCGDCALCRREGTNLCMAFLDTKKRGLMSDGTSRITCRGQSVQTFTGCATFSEYFVAYEEAVAKISPSADLVTVGLAGCCLPTGLGAVRVTARVRPDSVCAVWGLGGVGLAVVAGCRLAGAATIVGVDTNPDKEAVATKLGCTDFVNPADLDRPVEAYLQDRFLGGCDFTFECVGDADSSQAALAATRTGGGVCTVVGLCADPAKTFRVHCNDLIMGKELRGCLVGGYRFRYDLPALVDEIVGGALDCEDFITDRIKLEQINWAIEQMRAHQGVRYVIEF